MKFKAKNHFFIKRLFSTLLYNSNHNKSLGFKDSSDKYIPSSVRFVRWKHIANNWNRKCHSYFRNAICMFSVYDLPLLYSRPEFWADKFDLGFDPVAYQCMEEWYDDRVSLQDKLYTNLNYYCSQIEKHSSLAKCSWRPNPVKLPKNYFN
jgi:hypothetical protein